MENLNNLANNTANKSVGANKNASFKNQTNKVLVWLSMLFLIASLTMFIVVTEFSDLDELFGSGYEMIMSVLWLLFSFFAAAFLGIWYYLNGKTLSDTQRRKRGIQGIIFGTLCIAWPMSPIFGITAIVLGVLLLKQIYNQSNNE